MVAPFQREMTTWLAVLLQLISSVGVSDLFRYSDLNMDRELCSTDKVMVSFDILFFISNVHLQDTLQICVNALYRWGGSIFLTIYFLTSCI